MDIEVRVFAAIRCRNHKRLAVEREAYVADKSFVEDAVRGLAIINTALGFADINTSCFPLIRGSLASIRCSTGCGNAFRRPLLGRLPHEALNSLTGVNRSLRWRAFQEVTL